MQRHRTITSSQWLALATLLHLALFVALQTPERARHATPPVTPPQELVDVDTQPDAPAPPVVEARDDRAAEPGAPEPFALARSSPLSHVEPSRGGPAAGAGGGTEVLTAPGAGAEGAWTFNPQRGPDVLARGQVAATAAAGGREAARGPVGPASRTGGVAEALVQADVDRGLGLGGPVVAALEDVARTQDGPVRGVATFDVILHRGAEPEVFLQAADAEYDAWARLTRSMREAVAKKSVRIPASADSLQVTVKLDARVQYPDGSDPRKRGPFAKATGLEPGTESIVPKTVPGVTVGVVGKVCGAGLHVGMDGLGILGGCSPENIGTVPLRIVHGVEVSEVAM